MKRIALIILCFTLSIFFLSASADAMAGKPDTDKSASDIQETQALVRSTVDSMISAYTERDAMKFMDIVAADFTGDSVILDRAVRSDFSSFTNMDIRYTLNNVTSDDSDMVSVSIAFTRSYTDIKSGAAATKNGKTEIVFKREGEALQLYSMRSPLIFGISDPSVATGDSN